MQANEFAKKPQKPQKKTTQQPPAAQHPALVEKKLKFKIPQAMPVPEVQHTRHTAQSGVLPPGHTVKPGSELELIQDTDPELWARILKWD